MDIITQKEYEEMRLFEEFLEEKLILYSNGAKYGQVVFLAGGAASGKGFASNMFMEKEKFKVRDIDEWKTAFIKLDKIKAEVERRQRDPVNVRRWKPDSRRQRGVSSRELGKKRGISPDKLIDARELNLRKMGDVFKMHELIKHFGIKDKTLDLILGGANNPTRLPNIMFDMTLKDPKDLSKILPSLLAVGYEPRNIHLTWVLSNYQISIQANRTRDRVVPDHALLKTHKGAAKTMIPMLKGKLPKGMDGAVRVILNNRENTIPWTDSEGRPIKTKDGDVVIKDFTYLTIKKEGRPYLKDKDIKKQLFDWIAANVPKDTLTQQELDPER